MFQTRSLILLQFFFDLRKTFWVIVLLIIEKFPEFNIGCTRTVFFVENTPQVNFIFVFIVY